MYHPTHRTFTHATTGEEFTLYHNPTTDEFKLISEATGDEIKRYYATATGCMLKLNTGQELTLGVMEFIEITPAAHPMWHKYDNRQRYRKI